MQGKFKSVAWAIVLLATESEATARNRPGVPVSIDYAKSLVISEELSDVIFFGVMSSKIITINVDGPTVLVVRIGRANGDIERVKVTYLWDQKFLMKKEYTCIPKQPEACGRTIVRGIESASRLIRF